MENRRSTTVFNPNLVCENRIDAIDQICRQLLGSLGSRDLTRRAVAGMIARDQMMTTGVGTGFALPHTKIREDEKKDLMGEGWLMTGWFLCRSGVDWMAIDGRPVHLVAALITLNARSDAEHIKELASMLRARSKVDVHVLCATARTENEFRELMLHASKS